MGPLREKHRTAGSDNGGRYAAHSRDESEVELASVTVEIAGGPSQKLTPGVLDWHAEEALSTGQCVAFAVAVAERLGLDKIIVFVDTSDGDRIIHAWNETVEEPEMMLDSNGHQNTREYEEEFYRNRSENCGDCESCEKMWGCENPTDGEAGLEFRVISIAEARQIETMPLGRGLPKQSWKDVKSFVQPLLDSL
jgi:hypothetical protein